MYRSCTPWILAELLGFSEGYEATSLSSVHDCSVTDMHIRSNPGVIPWKHATYPLDFAAIAHLLRHPATLQAQARMDYIQLLQIPV